MAKRSQILTTAAGAAVIILALVGCASSDAVPGVASSAVVPDAPSPDAASPEVASPDAASPDAASPDVASLDRDLIQDVSNQLDDLIAASSAADGYSGGIIDRAGNRIILSGVDRPSSREWAEWQRIAGDVPLEWVESSVSQERYYDGIDDLRRELRREGLEFYPEIDPTMTHLAISVYEPATARDVEVVRGLVAETFPGLSVAVAITAAPEITGSELFSA